MNYTYMKIYTGAGGPPDALVTRDEAKRAIAALTVKSEAEADERMLRAEEWVMREVIAQSCEQHYDVAARVPGEHGPTFLIRVRPDPTAAPPTHTPEPWAIGFSDGTGRGENGDGCWITAGDHAAHKADAIVSVVPGGRDDWNVAKGPNPANAARIVACVNACAGIDPAAVPDLLAVCRSIVANYDAEGWLYDLAPDMDLIDAARAAISKAKGQ